jgi:ATP-dependent RNA helicase UAP56/SUB2
VINRIENYDEFKRNNKRIMVATDLFGRGIDIERVNVVINFDMPEENETYMHRVGRAGRFETKGFAVSFIATVEDENRLDDIQKCFSSQIKELPKEFDSSFTYFFSSFPF